jgi:oxygen-independent coproporphyrinogen-3 oxidase
VAGVYIAWPFCAQKCTFCNFASGVFPAALEREYEDALAGEIAAFDWPWRPETVYLGGGTPSRMAGETLERLLGLVPGRPWREATIEAAPGTVTEARARRWARLGIDRVSLGVQSFVPREIAPAGRKHTAEVVEREMRLLREEGIRRFNIDLIAGLACQTRESWGESLDWIERLDPGHVSVYMLEVDEDSRLGAEILRGGARYGARQAPPEELIVELYETAAGRLGALGLARYEISNFARPGEESLHNLKYWRLEPYAGFGADAHSFDGAVRRANAATPAEYVARRRRGEKPWVDQTPARLDEERFFVGLRLGAGIRPRPEEWARWAGPIERLVRDGLLARDGDALRLTRAGLVVSNEVFQEFITIP